MIQLWEQLFSIYGISRRPDAADPCGYGRYRERFLNARDTLRALLDNNIVPVINENDAVATAEIKSAITTISPRWRRSLPAPISCCCWTDQPGLFTADPRNNRRQS
ncbi:Glutamate 5-kinase [Raoultella planticola]|uniref:Glutamate 5-kinase n=1 Tax=Raoultella planticola TaxID=575 RepID=A0A485B3N1_RAOPL|nr:Glutamate 5-kinase [Raoultella planticola]